jgi:transposase
MTGLFGHSRRKLTRRAEPAVVRQEFVPASVAPTTRPLGEERAIELELRRGTMAIKLVWPSSAAAALAVFTRELLR